jgi:hypothetical protein
MERSPCSVDAGSCLVGARVDFVLVQALVLCNVGADKGRRRPLVHSPSASQVMHIWLPT